MFKFAWWYLAFFAVLPLLVRYYLPSVLKTETDALKIPFYQQILQLKASGLKLKRNINISYITLWIIWILVVLSSMRPQISYDPMLIQPKGRILMTAIDISGSMSIKDMMIESRKTDRLEVVKKLYNDFLEKRKGDRVGLVVFGSRAFLLAPPTFDRNSVKDALNDSSSGMAGPKTAIGDGLGLAIKYMDKAEEQNKVVILLSDGASNAGSINVDQAIELAKNAKAKIYTIAFGGDVLETDLGPFKAVVDISKQIDTVALKKIADSTGGKFFRAKDSKELEAYYNEINQIEPSTKNDMFLDPIRELFFVPLSLALLLLLGFICFKLYLGKRILDGV